MPDLPSRTDFVNTFASSVLQRAASRSTGRQFTASEIFTPGSDVNLIAVGASAMAEEIVRHMGRGLLDLTFGGARGAALDRKVADAFGGRLPRKGASAALVPLQLTRPTGTFGGFSYPALARVSTLSGVVFETQTAGTFAGAALGPITVTARAVNAGVAGNVDRNTITQKITVPADVTMVVGNAEPATGGDSNETDSSYVARAYAFIPALARGGLPAIEFGARTVPGIRSASAVEELDAGGNLTGRVFLYVADVNGQANTALAAAVNLALREYRSGGLPVLTVGGVPVFQAIAYHLAFETGIDTVGAFAQVQALTVARVNQIAPMAPLLRSMLFETARLVPGVVVLTDAVTVPAGDVIPAAGSGQVIKTSSSVVTNA